MTTISNNLRIIASDHREIPMQPLAVSDENPVGQRFAVVLAEEPDGGYSVSVPALPGCYSEGDTLEEALANIREAIAVHLEPPTQAEVLRIRIEEVEV
jgi:predicted RNase H-like HicB family nuclease